MWIKRVIIERFRALAAQRPAILLTGARQTGKTSLIKHLFPKAHYVSFDLPQVAAAAEENPTEFLGQFNGMVILDEVQYVPALFRHLKTYIDDHRTEHGKWILTGSQKFQLMKEISDSLAGRIGVLELDTLSAHEIRLAGLDHANYEFTGGYPELWAEPMLNRKQFYQDYMITYLERDLKKILAIESLRAFDRFIRSCALRAGQLTNFTELTKDASVSSVTGKKWFEVLEASNICATLEPYFNNHLKRLVKSPKIYFRDQGILCSLLNIHSKPEYHASHAYGAVFENFVFNELLRAAELSSKKKSLFFLRDKNNLEVDFLIERGSAIHLIEAKTSEFPQEAITQLEKIGTLFSKHHTVHKYIACKIPEKKPIKIKGVLFFNPLNHDIPAGIFNS